MNTRPKPPALAALFAAALFAAALFAGCAGAPRPIPALTGPGADTLAQPLPDASFRDARAVAVDPLGAVYVAAAGAVVRFAPEAERAGEGERILRITGSDAAALVAPAALDATNGLQLLVADLDGGRVVRFGRDGLVLDVLTPDDNAGSRTGAFEPARRASDDAGRGGDFEPVGVREDDEGNVVALDRAGRRLVRWTPTRQFSALTREDAPPGEALRDPRALERVGAALFVLDGDASVARFDRFGTFGARFAIPPGAVGLAAAPGALVVVYPAILRRFAPDGTPGAVLALRVPGAARAAALDRGRAYVLTATALFAVPLPPGAER